MSEWCMAHPFLTTFLVFLTLAVISNVVANICKAVIIGQE